MARAKHWSAEDRLAARLARMGGVALSQDDLGQLDDDPPGAEQTSAGQLVRKLLAALGAQVNGEDDAATMAAAMVKIRELKSGGRKSKGDINPLIPGGVAKIDPLYLSLSLTDRLNAENERLKMAKHASDIALALAPPPSLSTADEDSIVSDFARRMGAVPEPGGVSLSTDEDRLADLLVKRMPGGATGR